MRRSSERGNGYGKEPSGEFTIHSLVDCNNHRRQFTYTMICPHQQSFTTLPPPTASVRHMFHPSSAICAPHDECCNCGASVISTHSPYHRLSTLPMPRGFLQQEFVGIRHLGPSFRDNSHLSNRMLAAAKAGVSMPAESTRILTHAVCAV